MYNIREVTIGQGTQVRKRLVIEFTNPNEAILGELLMTEGCMLDNELLLEIEEVIRGKRTLIVGSGNRCGWKIDRNEAVINDLFEDMEGDIPVLPTCTIDTTQLYELIKMWVNKCSFYYNT